MHCEPRRTAVVTGGTRGIGRAVVADLLSRGLDVLLTGTEINAARRAADEVAQSISVTSEDDAPMCYAIDCRVEDEASVSRVAAFAADRLGHVDVLVNNAGMTTRGRLEDIALAEWNRVLAINLTGIFLMTKAIVPHMSGPSPSIVNVSSQAAKLGSASLCHYAAAKAGQIGFTKSLARELAPRIRVNAVCPGLTMTDLLEDQLQQQAAAGALSYGDVVERAANRVPLGRLQTPESVAAVVAFLSSEDSAELTGQALNASGGMVME